MRLLCTALLLAFATHLPAQTTESDLKARLIGKPLYLRGLWAEDRLDFDEAGQPSDNPVTTSVMLSGINVKSVKLTANALILEGVRAGLTFQKDTPKRINLRLPEASGFFSHSHDRKMHVEIKLPKGGDFKQPLDAIFTENLGDLVSALPSYWQAFFDLHLADIQASRTMDYQPERALHTPPSPGIEKIGGPVTPPTVLHQPEPSFDDEARASRLSGRVLVYLQVDETGSPRKLRILRPLGLGLDEQAVKAVSQYTFKPAMRNGTPVAVEMNVEVHFQIF